MLGLLAFALVFALLTLRARPHWEAGEARRGLGLHLAFAALSAAPLAAAESLGFGEDPHAAVAALVAAALIVHEAWGMVVPSSVALGMPGPLPKVQDPAFEKLITELSQQLGLVAPPRLLRMPLDPSLGPTLRLYARGLLRTELLVTGIPATATDPERLRAEATWTLLNLRTGGPWRWPLLLGICASASQALGLLTSTALILPASLASALFVQSLVERRFALRHDHKVAQLTNPRSCAKLIGAIPEPCAPLFAATSTYPPTEERIAALGFKAPEIAPHPGQRCRLRAQLSRRIYVAAWPVLFGGAIWWSRSPAHLAGLLLWLLAVMPPLVLIATRDRHKNRYAYRTQDFGWIRDRGLWLIGSLMAMTPHLELPSDYLRHSQALRDHQWQAAAIGYALIAAHLLLLLQMSRSHCRMFWLIQQRRWDEALEAVAPELLRQPEHSYWLLRRAQLLALRGDRTQAIELVRKLCIPQPTHLLSASTLFELQLHHDPVAARGLGERCMKEQPHNRHSARIFARGVLATQEWDVAEQVLQVGIQEFPDDQVLLALRAELTLRREETKPNKPAAQAARRDLAAAMENGLEEPLQAIVCARLQQRLGEEPSQTRHLAEQLLDIYPLTLLQEEFARG